MGKSWLAAGLLIQAAWAAPAWAGPSDEAKSAFEGQMAAWNRGDLEGALAGYWASSGMTWVNKGGVSHGFQTFADGMRQDFAADPASMGHYEGAVLEAQDLAPDAALIVVRWSISREGRPAMGGISTQLWRKLGGTWRAVFEHAS